jgi:hypothetical protein
MRSSQSGVQVLSTLGICNGLITKANRRWKSGLALHSAEWRFVSVFGEPPYCGRQGDACGSQGKLTAERGAERRKKALIVGLGQLVEVG